MPARDTGKATRHRGLGDCRLGDCRDLKMPAPAVFWILYRRPAHASAMTSATFRSRPASTFICAAVVVGLAAAMPAALHAQSTPPPPVQKSEKMARPEATSGGAMDKTSAAKLRAAKQQKLKDCSAKWQDEK